MSWQQNLTAGIIRVTMRASFLLPSLAGPPGRAVPPRGVTTEAATIADVPCFWIGSGARDDVIVYLHGGGYSGQASRVHWDWSHTVSGLVGVPVLLVDYALSGEHTYPYAVEQVIGVITELRKQGARRVLLGGDSAGGGLAVAVASRLRDAGEGVTGLILISPWLDVTLADPAIQALVRHDVMLTVDGLLEAGRAYAGEVDARTPGISPLYGHPAGLPAAIVHVGDRELFLPDDTAWASAVTAAGGDVELHVIPGGFHVSPVFVRLPESRRAIAQQVEFARRMLPSS